MFTADNPFNPSLLYEAKTRSLPFEHSSIGDSTLKGSGLAYKYKTRVEVTDIGKHTSLLQNIITYGNVSYGQITRLSSHWSCAQIIFLANFAGQGISIRKHKTLDGSKSPPKYIIIWV